jgi:hypothetical protein
MSEQGPRAFYGRNAGGVRHGQGSPYPPGATPPTQAEADMARMEAELQQLREDYAGARKKLSDIRSLSGLLGIVLTVQGKEAVVTTAPGKYHLLDVSSWPDVVPGTAFEIKPNKEGGLFAVRPVELPPAGGRIVTVARLHGDVFEYAGDNGGMRGARVGRDRVEPGDRVMLDQLGEIVVRHLGREKARTVGKIDRVEWDDIGGLADVKRELQEAIIDPVKYKELYAAFGQEPPKGILLCGPPGCGKTLLARAVATALADLHGKSAVDSGFLTVNGPEILNMYVGNSEANIRLAFETARRHEKEHGYPCVIFFDEVDALAAERGVSRNEGMEKTIVPQLLVEMDGLEKSSALVLFATNRPGLLDPAIRRDGRLDRNVFVKRPDRMACEEIFHVHLRRRPCELDELVKLGAALLFDDGSEETLLGKVSVHGEAEPKLAYLRDVVHGGMIEGIVQRAGQLALREAKAKKMKPAILEGHLKDAVRWKMREARTEPLARDVLEKIVGGEKRMQLIESVEMVTV